MLPFALLAACSTPPTLPDDGKPVVWTPAVQAPCQPERVNLTAAFDHVLAGVATPCELDAISLFADRRRAGHGPWRQDLRMAVSPDGLTFQEVEGLTLATSAAVPEAVRGPDGRVYLFYVDGDLDHLVDKARTDSAWLKRHGLPGLGALKLLVSDDGRSFSEVPDFGIEGLVGGMVVDPDVVALPDGTWRLYYVGMPVMEYLEKATWDKEERHEVYLATSTDLVHWVQQGPALRGPFADPCVLCDFSTNGCTMFSFGLDWSESEDGGRSFRFRDQWGPPGFAPDVVDTGDGGIRLYYNDMAAQAPIRSLRSPDRQSWIEEPGVRLPDAYGEAPSVVRTADGSWLMYYHALREGDERPWEMRWQDSPSFRRTLQRIAGTPDGERPPVQGSPENRP